MTSTVVVGRPFFEPDAFRIERGPDSKDDLVVTLLDDEGQEVVLRYETLVEVSGRVASALADVVCGPFGLRGEIEMVGLL